jgi:hypothetical protein
MATTAAAVRRGAIHRAAALAAEDITGEKLVLRHDKRQSPTTARNGLTVVHPTELLVESVAIDSPGSRVLVGYLALRF